MCPGCHHSRSIATSGGAQRPFRRLLAVGRWLIPSAGLALMPKCPACVAAYIALATGVGLSLPTAAILRSLLVAICVVSLFYLASMQAWRMAAPPSPSDDQAR